MTDDAPAMTGPPPPRLAGTGSPRVDLFVISFVILFFELSCIRWFGSTVIFLTFFTNIALIACVLGMSVGCLAAARRWDGIHAVFPLTLAAAALAQGTLRAYVQNRLLVDVGNQQSPQQIYFGTESAGVGSFGGGVPIEVFAGLFFALIALLFVGPGQALGRAFDALPNRLAAYTTNVAGSLAGIVAFGLVSYARTPPTVWFALALGPALIFTRRWAGLHALFLLAILYQVGRTPGAGPADVVAWSPYYKILYKPESKTIFTNNIGHQQMVPVGTSGAAYELPYLLNRDAGGPPRRDVLVIGAGSGNDVRAALKHGAGHVDAVEIDPVLNELGRAHHPDRPYDDPRVSIRLDDGRGFVRKTRARYDQVVYALLDSLVLHSGYSSLRLESFLFTEQAFADVRDRLRPGGVFVMYNYFRQGWVVGRLAKMAETVFGTKPIVISLPYKAKIGPDQAQSGLITMLIVGRTEAAVAPIRARFERGESFWVHVSPDHNAALNAYGPKPPALAGTQQEHWQKIAPAAVDTAGVRRVPTDDWPFLYLRSPTVPWFNLRGVAIMLAVALVMLRVFAPAGGTRPDGRMFFLGAGFMLLETKGVVHLALLFGSTWVVNSVVFFAILVMILLSNLYALAVRPGRTRVYYALLFLALAVNLAVPMTGFLALPGPARVAASCAVIFVPIFFAGVIFSVAFRDSARPDLDLGANIGGVVLGGLSEYLSLVVGFNGLLLVAAGYYLLSALLAPRGAAAPPPPGRDPSQS